MVFLIIGAILIIVGLVALFGAFASESDEGKFGGYGVFALSVIGFIILLIACSYNRVPQREVGVKQSFSGAITGVTGHGNQWVKPWESVSTVNIGLTREDFVLDKDNSAVSSDQQPIFANLTLNYHLDPSPDKVLKLYKQVGPNWRAILIDSRVLQDFKEVTSGFTAQEITTKREQLRELTKAKLVTELGKYDITVDDFFVRNLDYTDSYKEAINSKNIQVQQAQQALAKVAQAKAEAQQHVATASGDARATFVKAQAEAKALTLKGKALRNNPEILQLEAIDKLNPNAQVIICTGSGSNNCPSFLPQATSSK